MSPQGRPKGEYRSAQHEGASVSPQGRPKGEYRSAQHEGASVSPQGHPKGDRPAVAPSTIGMTAKAIAWSFFGVRRRRDHDHASVRINPIHVIVAGFIGVFVFVIGLMVLVRWVAA